MVKKTAAFTILALILVPWILGDFYTYVIAEAMLISLLALSNNLELGYGGMLQLHQCTYYGVGAYAFALFTMKGGMGFIPSSILAILVASLVGLIIGWFCVRLHGIYFGMLTVALGQLVWAIVFKWYSFTGGDNGIQCIPVPALLKGLKATYYFILVFSLLSSLVIYLIVRSPFGRVLQGIRDNKTRCEAVGVDVKRHQLKAYVIASFFAGIAGVLYAIHARSISPDMMFWEKSAEVLIMCLLGGMYTFSGPIVGAFIITLFNAISSAYTEYQSFILGILLVILVTLLPQGIVGALGDAIRGKRA